MQRRIPTTLKSFFSNFIREEKNGFKCTFPPFFRHWRAGKILVRQFPFLILEIMIMHQYLFHFGCCGAQHKIWFFASSLHLTNEPSQNWKLLINYDCYTKQIYFCCRRILVNIQLSFCVTSPKMICNVSSSSCITEKFKWPKSI